MQFQHGVTPSLAYNLKTPPAHHALRSLSHQPNTPPHARHALYPLGGPSRQPGLTPLKAPMNLGLPESPASPAHRPSPSSSSFTSLAAFSPSSRKLRSIILLRSTAALSSALNVQPMAAAGEGTGLGLTDTPRELRFRRLRRRLLLGGGPLRQLLELLELPDIRCLRHFRQHPAAVTARTFPAGVP